MTEELFQLKNGQFILDESASAKMFLIKENKPEAKHSTDTGYEWSEIGMANLFAHLYDKECRYCPEHKSWYTYYDGAWRKDKGAILVAGKLKDFVRLMIMYCGEITDDEQRKSYTAFVNKMGDRRMRDRILRDAEEELLINAVEFDSHPNLINCINGTYDLNDFTFHEHKWSDFLTMQTAFKHTVRKDVKCERWEQFIAEVTQGEKSKADYLQRALGYSIFGTANEECMFILHGKTTRNGKSTLLHVIKTLLGDYALVSPVGLICKQRNAASLNAASPEIVRLKGKRFVTMSESNEYGKMDEEKIKQLTGGEEVTGRALYEDVISFLPQFTLWLSCNDLPMVTDKSLFASDRIRVIEFNRHFTQDEQDMNLKNELTSQEAMSGIFMWLIRGYMKYKRRGLEMPVGMRKVIRKYERDNDVVLQFLEARCEKDPESRIKQKDLYNAFKTWARAEGYPMLSSLKFKGELERHPDWWLGEGLTHGYYMHLGIKLKEVY